MNELAVDRRKPFILSERKTGREGTLCHLEEIPSGCFCWQDIGCVSGKPPASRETYWITDNLGMDRARTEGVYVYVGSVYFILFLPPVFSILFLTEYGGFLHLIKATTGLKLNMCVGLAFNVHSKLYLSSHAMARGYGFRLH